MSRFESPKTRQESSGAVVKLSGNCRECSKIHAELFSHKLFESFSSNEYLQQCLLCFRNPLARVHERIINKVRTVNLVKLTSQRNSNILN